MFFCLILSRYDAGKDNYIDLMELKLMMEKLGAPQTHIGLKNMIKEVDEDLDNKLSFREVKQEVFFKKEIKLNKNSESESKFLFYQYLFVVLVFHSSY